MALYHKWDVKNDFAYVLQFFSLISDSLGGVIDFAPFLPLCTFQIRLSLIFQVHDGSWTCSSVSYLGHFGQTQDYSVRVIEAPILNFKVDQIQNDSIVS